MGCVLIRGARGRYNATELAYKYLRAGGLSHICDLICDLICD